MKKIIILLLMATSMNLTGQDGKATTVKKTFSRTTTVELTINASSSIIWKLLIDAENYPKWNSTIVSIDGKIREGNKIKLKSQLDPKRTFKLKIKEFIPETKLVWGDAMGTRVYKLVESTDGKINFQMVEKIGSPMFPLFANQIPSFDASFEAFARDLKKEAERITNR